MLLWGLFWGALAGAIADGFMSAVAGAVLGALAGLTLRAVVRGEIESQTAELLHRARADALAEAAAVATAQERRSAPDSPRPDSAAPEIPRPDIPAPEAATRVPSALPPRAAPDPDFDLDPDFAPAAAQALASAPPDAAATTAPIPAGTAPPPVAPPAIAGQPVTPPPVAPPSVADAPAPRPPAPRPRRTPADAAALPEPVDLAARLRDWLFGGNAVVRVGALLIFLGLAFLVRWAAERAVFPVGARVALAGFAGMALLATGWRLRERRPGYAMTLQGAGVAIVYLTAYAALRLYDLIAPGTAFTVMAGICALATVLALRQDSMSLAVLAFGGGFAAPVLASTGHGSHVALFGWYALLDLAVMFIAARRQWRALSRMAFIATFAIATVWGVLRYRPELFATTEPFLLLFFALFTAAGVLPALRRLPPAATALDGMLVFGTPLVAFALQAKLVDDTEYGLAWSALALGLLYLLLARRVGANAGPAATRATATAARAGHPDRAATADHTATDDNDAPDLRLLADALLALGIGFLTLAIPLAFGSGWTSAGFALEGAGLAWIGLRQRRWLPRLSGVALQFAAGLFFLDSVSVTRWQQTPFANEDFLGAALLAASAFLVAWWLRALDADAAPGHASRLAGNARAGTRGDAPRATDLAGTPDAAPASLPESLWRGIERLLPEPMWLLGFGWTLAAFALDITRNVVGPDSLLAPAWPHAVQPNLMLLAFCGCALAAWLAGARLGWPVAQWPARWTLPVLAATVCLDIGHGLGLTDAYGALVWPLTLAAHFRLLRAADLRDATARDGDWLARRLGNPVAPLLHAGTVWLLTLLAGWVVWRHVDDARLWRSDWAAVLNAGAAAAVLLGLVLWNRLGAASWPIAAQPRAWRLAGALPAAGLLLLGNGALALLARGDTPPLPWIALANPVDLVLVAGLAVFTLWWRLLADRAAEDSPAPSPLLGLPPVLLALAAFLDLNTMWLRIAHHLAGVPWTHEALFHSPLVQLGYALLWTVLAFVLMLSARRGASRALWLCGAGLLGLVVLKLFVVDLANAGSGERIAAFIGTGVLMLVVGYVAPMPPAEDEAPSASARKTRPRDPAPPAA
ncbi:DUF2339 domain-containing protein [Derxia gummosa]|uniref:DUF2339 domain-containing protein n=1 Tax=Derxia gummosa DSM 723 TaxID=1121388 RepID=A0A8B6X3Y4_9BURK|nr:DUF2339 domain-containing protein [Derxia gummosa]